MLLFFRNRLSQSVRHVNGLSDTHLIYTVNMLKERATGYLDQNDTAQASEKTFQGCKLALMEYVKRLEKENDFQIVPEHLANPWNYRTFKKFCDILIEKVDYDLAEELNNGWKHAYSFHTEGWTQNNLTVRSVKLSLPYAFRNISTKERAASVTLFHLTPLMTYRISVAARTNAGIGVFHPVEIIKMNAETLEQHRELYGETSSPILALLRQPWFLVLLTVLGWIVLIAIAVFLFMRYKRNSSGIKKRNGSFIKINDGSIHVGQNTLWDQGGTVHLGRLPPGNRTIMSQPFISGSPAGREMHEYAMGGQDGVYHYAQAPGDNYSSKFQDDPSPYATTTIVMSNDSAAFRNDGTILRPPPSNTIPHNPPFGIETEIERINDKYIERATNRRRNIPSPPQNPSYGHRLKNTIGSTLPRSPPKQTLFDFIPPPPMNPPPLLNNIAADRYEEARRAADGAISRTAAARLQKSKNADELSQRSSLLSDEDEELQSLHDGPLTSTHKKMPRMGISATFLNSND